MTTQVEGFLGVRNLAMDFENHVDFQLVRSTIDALFTNYVVGSFEKSEELKDAKRRERRTWFLVLLIDKLGKFVTELGQPVELGYSLADL
ncbi:hypothetical protein Gotri_023031, partial [Gossypium trilobum]|nr:hypothetical protein [Gossypium trilobum]